MSRGLRHSRSNRYFFSKQCKKTGGSTFLELEGNNPIMERIMKKTNITLSSAIMAIVLTLTSCDPVSSVEFRIYNKTADTVTVAMYKEIMTSSYKGYTIIENDSVSTDYVADSCKVAVLAPEQVLVVDDSWSGLYREEQVIPFWKYITSITIGETEMRPELWNNEAAWHLKTVGGGRFEDESRYYDIVLRD